MRCHLDHTYRDSHAVALVRGGGWKKSRLRERYDDDGGSLSWGSSRSVGSA